MQIIVDYENFNGDHVRGLPQILQRSQWSENEGALPSFYFGNGSELDPAWCVLICKEALLQKYELD